MAKSSKQRKTGRDVYDDKPDFAMDLFKPEVAAKKKNEKEKEREDALSVRDRLGGSALSMLEKLKQDIAASDAANASPPENGAPSGPAKKVAVRSGERTGDKQPNADGNANLSFAELFDPQPEDDIDFESMLKGSKQDWREYK